MLGYVAEPIYTRGFKRHIEVDATSNGMRNHGRFKLFEQCNLMLVIVNDAVHLNRFIVKVFGDSFLLREGREANLDIRTILDIDSTLSPPVL